jgi:hypothetical protein
MFSIAKIFFIGQGMGVPVAPCAILLLWDKVHFGHLLYESVLSITMEFSKFH